MNAILLMHEQASARLGLIKQGLLQAEYVFDCIQQEAELDVSAVIGSEVETLIVLVVSELTPQLLQQIQYLDQQATRPMLLCVNTHNSEFIEPAVLAGMGAYCCGDFSADVVEYAAGVAQAQFVSRQKLKTDIDDAKLKLQDRKLIERAKGILMEKKKLSERDAYRVMRQAAMNRAQPLVQVAASIIQVSELLYA